MRRRRSASAARSSSRADDRLASAQVFVARRGFGRRCDRRRSNSSMVSQEAAPVLHRLPDAGDVEGLRFEHEGAHEGGGIEDRLERDGVREGAQEMARLRHRARPRAGGPSSSAVKRSPEARNSSKVRPAGAKVLGDLGPGRDEATARRFSHVIGDLEAVAHMDEAGQGGLAAVLGAGRKRQSRPRRRGPWSRSRRRGRSGSRRPRGWGARPRPGR